MHRQARTKNCKNKQDPKNARDRKSKVGTDNMARILSKIGKHTEDSPRILMAADNAQKQKKGDSGGDGGDASAKGEGSKKMAKKGEDLKGEMDALVEDIDAVLEENAEEFVKNYVQRGGQ
jgi:ubiquitin-like protein Pup